MCYYDGMKRCYQNCNLVSVALIHITRENSHSRGCSYYKRMKTFWRIYRGKMWSEERQPESKKFLWERESEREKYTLTQVIRTSQATLGFSFYWAIKHITWLPVTVYAMLVVLFHVT